MSIEDEDKWYEPKERKEDQRENKKENKRWYQKKREQWEKKKSDFEENEWLQQRSRAELQKIASRKKEETRYLRDIELEKKITKRQHDRNVNEIQNKKIWYLEANKNSNKYEIKYLTLNQYEDNVEVRAAFVLNHIDITMKVQETQSSVFYSEQEGTVRTNVNEENEYEMTIFFIKKRGKRDTYVRDSKVLVCNNKFELVSLSTFGSEQPYKRNKYGFNVISIIYNEDFVNEYQFKDFNTLRKVTLTKRVSRIPENAFAECEMLEDFDFKSVRCIGSFAFVNTGFKVIELPDVEFIYSRAFYKCKNLEKVVINPKVKYIAPHAFANCPKLMKVIILEDSVSVNSVSEEVDIPEKKIEKGETSNVITIRNTGEEIDDEDIMNVFDNEKKQTKMHHEIALNATSFIECHPNLVVEINGLLETAIITYYKNWSHENFMYKFKITDYEANRNHFPNVLDFTQEQKGVFFISATMNYYREGKGCCLPEYITKYVKCNYDSGELFKKYCDFKNIFFQKVTKDAFGIAIALCDDKYSVVPRLTTIPSRMFMDQTILEKVHLPKSVFRIGHECFKNCVNLKYINLRNVMYIGGAAFQNCKNLEDTLFSKLVSVDIFAFYGCEKLKTLDFSMCECITPIYRFIESFGVTGMHMVFTRAKYCFFAYYTVRMPVYLFEEYQDRIKMVRNIVKDEYRNGYNTRIITDLSKFVQSDAFTKEVGVVLPVFTDQWIKDYFHLKPTNKPNEPYVFANGNHADIDELRGLCLLVHVYETIGMEVTNRLITPDKSREFVDFFTLLETIKQYSFPSMIFIKPLRRENDNLKTELVGAIDPLLCGLVEPVIKFYKK